MITKEHPIHTKKTLLITITQKLSFNTKPLLTQNPPNLNNRYEHKDQLENPLRPIQCTERSVTNIKPKESQFQMNHTQTYTKQSERRRSGFV